MTTEHPNGTAPSAVAGNKGNKGGRVAQAWQYVWDNLSATEWTGGQEIAARAAARFDLKPTSVLTHIIRMAGENALEVRYEKLPREATRVLKAKDGTIKLSTYTTHQRCAFYRIKR